jgi:hypothetical protein
MVGGTAGIIEHGAPPSGKLDDPSYMTRSEVEMAYDLWRRRQCAKETPLVFVGAATPESDLRAHWGSSKKIQTKVSDKGKARDIEVYPHSPAATKDRWSYLEKLSKDPNYKDALKLLKHAVWIPLKCRAAQTINDLLTGVGVFEAAHRSTFLVYMDVFREVSSKVILRFGKRW